jgi:phage recombination protein Bet
MTQTAQKTADSEPRVDQVRSLVVKLADKFHVDAEKFLHALKTTAFRQRNGSAPSNEQMMALMVVCDQYGLIPFLKEIYAFPDKNNSIVPVVGVDGWSRIINTHKQFDGVEFRYSDSMVKMDYAHSKAPEWIEAVLYRKDRSRPVVIREYLDECYRPPQNGYDGAWQTHPKRFLRHKALIQGARIGFGFVGIYDQDEAERIIGNTFEHKPGEVVTMAPKVQAAQMDDEEYDQLIENCISRGKAEGAWPSIQQYLEERFQNNPAQPEPKKEAAEEPKAPAKKTTRAKPKKTAQPAESDKSEVKTDNAKLPKVQKTASEEMELKPQVVGVEETGEVEGEASEVEADSQMPLPEW